ncbi:MAG: outer membrane beta-barrel protein [Micropepsaceae bacterium]
MRTIASVSVSALALALVASVAPASAEGFAGFYAGLQLGDTFGDASSSQNVSLGDPLSVSQADYSFGAMSGGFHVGYNHKFDNLIAGAVFDYSMLDAGDSDVESSAVDNHDHNSLTFDTIYSFRAIGGWQALPGTLLYATAGYAWASADASVDFTTASATSEGKGVTFAGFTYGLGTSFAMTDNTTIGFEWRHLSLDHDSVAFGLPENDYELGFDPDLDTVEVRVSYFFAGMMN